MKEDKEDIIPVIKQKDPFFEKSRHLDFQWLRSEGLKHIGNLSGKIWTDHNTHDPGITILEVLCYALIDLGYRSTLPIEDLLASGQKKTNDSLESEPEINFFTPREILSCNPTTITDYRKLLLEVKGVRNAWLEPAKEQEVPLFLIDNRPEEKSLTPELTCSNASGKLTSIYLNGLYQILIEKEPDAREAKIIKDIQKILSTYRNLCEDFKDITLLCPLKVGICADVEIEKNADKTKIYKAIIKAIQAYIAPEIIYYTLQQLLDKNKPIEEVFAGRPCRNDSFGFVDTYELENLARRKYLYASDVYQAILSIEGVVAISELTFQTTNFNINNSNIQQLTLPENHVGVFDLDQTCIQIRSGQGILHINKSEIHGELLKNGKSRLNQVSLDLPIPEGNFYSEFGDYYSIQHDFPLVYGIGEGGLSEEATQQRKIQALQLKGYLLFFDHLLANYLAQLSNLGNLFSLRQETARHVDERQTYFTQNLENVPGVEQLLQIQAAKSLNEGYLIAIPVANNDTLAQKLHELSINPRKELLIKDSCDIPEGGLAHYSYSSETHRDVQMQQAIRNADREDYTLEIHEEKKGKFFLLRFHQISEFVFISYQRYGSFSEVQEMANFTAFMASIPENYRKTIRQNETDEIEYQIALSYNPSAYTLYLKYLQESEQLYHQRRQAFLDHLLARFASQFTDYSLLRFLSAESGKQDLQQTIEDKSKFLNHFDDISRDRGRAFNYLRPSWGTQNVSGYEKRISLLTGMPDWTRRWQCKFEVVPKYYIELKDLNGNSWLRSIATYASKADVTTANTQLREQLRQPENYSELQPQFHHFNAEIVGRIFSEIPTEENIQESQYQYALQLKNLKGEVLLNSNKKDYLNQASAWSALPKFLKEIKNELPDKELVEVGRKSRKYIDSSQLRYQIKSLATKKERTRKGKKTKAPPPQYKWQLNEAESQKVILESDKIFDSEQKARGDFEERLLDILVKQPDSNIAQHVYSIELLPIPSAFKFIYHTNTGEKSQPLLISEKNYTSKTEAEKAYTKFVRALHEGTFTLGEAPKKITVSESNAAVLAEDTEDNQEKVKRLVEYLKEPGFENDEKWIYRLLDLNNPIAKGIAKFKSREDAEVYKRELCSFKPYLLGPKKQVIKIICPELSPSKYHYALCLQDEEGVDFTFLISYMGYLSKETAQEAANESWLKIIELAANKDNYGENKFISLEEVYSKEIDTCEGTNPYLAVIPNSFQPTKGIPPKEKAIALARRYPIRIRYKKDKDCKTTNLIDGYIFQGFDLNLDNWVWRSKKIYPGIEEAIEGYRLFLVILGNPDSCRVICEKGFFKIELVEILAESKEFNTEGEAWDDPLNKQKDVCGKEVCLNQGVRLFADAAVSETAFIQVNEDNCYRFRVVDKHYQVAKHTCNYHSSGERDDALRKMQRYILSLKNIDYKLTNGNSKIKYFIGDGYSLESLDNTSHLKESEKDQMVLEWMRFAVVEKNIVEKDGDLFIINPKNKELPIAKIGQEEDNIDKKHFLEIVRQYPIFKKENSYCFHLYYPENGGYLDEELKICGWEEKQEIRPENPDFCGKSYILESAQCYPCLAAAENAFQYFLELSNNASNYQPTEESGIGPYSFTIVDPAKILAYHPNCHPDQTSALKAASRIRASLEDHGMHLAEHILLRPQPQNKAACDCLLPVCPDFDCDLTWQEDLEEDDPCAAEESPPMEYIPGADPYSFWATLVLPGWHQRFQSSEARHFFKEMLHREAPAMVGLNILWLSPRMMCQFESAYERWLEWYSNPNRVCEDQDNPVCALVKCISQLQNDPPCITQEAAFEDCSCLSSEQKKNDPCLEVSDQLFWLDCQPNQKTSIYRGTDQATGSISMAPSDVKEGLSTEESTTTDFKEMAIRQMFSEREDVYKSSILEISDEKIKSLEIFDRAVFFVTNPPSLSEYQQLVTKVVDEVKGDKRTKRYQSIETILLNVTWSLLDHLVRENPDNIPAQDKSSLTELLSDMKTKKIEVQKIASGWKSKPLQELLAASVVKEYIQLIEKFK